MAGYSFGSFIFDILVKNKKGELHHDSNKLPTEYDIDRGALLLEILPNERIPREDGGPPHNYTLYTDPRVTLYDDGTSVCPLHKAELDYLAAIDDPITTFVQYNKQDKLPWIMDLRVGDVVYFRLPSKSTSGATAAIPIQQGRVRHYGQIPDHNGVMFGLEIMDPQYRGKGTTDGSPHFNCGHNNAVYVAMDKIVKKANKRNNEQPKETEEGASIAITQQPGWRTKGGAPAEITQSKRTDKLIGEGKDKTLYKKAKGIWKAVTPAAPPIVIPTAHASDVPSQFSINDCVVLQPADGGVIEGIVRWVGPVRMGRDSGNIVIPVVGIETARPVNHETEFPGLTYSVTGSQGTELFEVPHYHGRIFVAEQIVISEEEHKQQKKEEDTEEMREAKKFGLSLEEFRQQRDIHLQAKIAKDRQHSKEDTEEMREAKKFALSLEEYRQQRDIHSQANKKKVHHRPVLVEEDLTSGNGTIRNISNKQNIPTKPDDTPILSEQSLLGQEEMLEKLSKQRKKDKASILSQNSSVDCERKSCHQDQHVVHTSLMAHAPTIARQHSSDPGYHQDQDGHQFLDDAQQQWTPEPRIRRHNNTSPSLPSRTNELSGYHGDRHPSHYGGMHPGHHGEGESYQSNLPPSSHQHENFPSSAASGSGPSPRLPSIPSDPTQFTIGTMVEIPMTDDTVRHGIIRWIGQIPGFQGQFGGVELDYPLEGCSEGTYNGVHYFTCSPGKGFFSLLAALQLNTRFIEPHQVPAAKQQDSQNPLDVKKQKSLLNQAIEERNQFEEKVIEVEELLKMKEKDLVTLQKESKLKSQRMIQKLEELQRVHQEEVKNHQSTKRDFEKYRREMDRVLEEVNQQEKLDQWSWRINNNEIQVMSEELGGGGWGSVRVGMFREQRVAVKQLYNILKSKQNLAVMNREINTMSRLRHPNLLLFIGAVLDHPSGNPLIITEIMDISLRQAYEKGQLTEETSKLSILRDTACGLNYLHCHHDEIIHRDVSSANVLLESRGTNKWRAKLSDFGSANITRNAVTGLMGAQVYSAPEALVAITDETPCPQTTKMDVYSYGILACEVMTCQFPDRSQFKSMLVSVQANSPAIGRIVSSCTLKNPSDRPTMTQIIKMLQ